MASIESIKWRHMNIIQIDNVRFEQSNLRNSMATSHHWKFVFNLVQMAPFFDFSDGVSFTISSLAIVMPEYCQNGTELSFCAR